MPLKVKKSGTFQTVGGGEGEKLWYQNFPSGLTDTNSVTVASSSTAHTKGSWTQLIASTSAYGNTLGIFINNFANSTDSSVLLDIAVGSSGDETIIVSNLAIGHNNLEIYWLPVSVPAGTRISARTQAATAPRNATIGAIVQTFGTLTSYPTSVDVYGGNTATSQGVQMTNNTYVEVTSSTTQAYKAILVVPSGNAASLTTSSHDLKVAKGASGSEVDITKIGVTQNSAETVVLREPKLLRVFPAEIPAGTRLSVHISGGANQSNISVCVIGIP